MRNVSVTIWMMVVVVLCLISSRSMAVVDFNDGQTHNIDYLIDDHVFVDYKAPGMQTTVNVLKGGTIQRELYGYEESRINISGGTISEDLDIRDNSQATISSGIIGRHLWSFENGHATVACGMIGGYLISYDNSQITISGGVVGGMARAFNNSEISIFGGSIGDELHAVMGGVITIFGSDFAVDGQAVEYGKLTSIYGGGYDGEPLRILTGRLSSGELIDNGFRIADIGSIILKYDRNPEPFRNPDYWSVFDAPVELPESSLKAYVRAAFDGRFIYFPSYSMVANPSGYFLRYDTHGDFFDGESSWEYYRPDDVLSCDARGYIDAIVVGQYVYFCPYFNNDHHGVMLRYDVTKDFNEPNAWKCFDPSTAKPDADLVGFAGIASDGQYLYFAPRVGVASKVLRYDTNGVFDNVLSWDSFDLKPVVGGTAGYTDCVFDGQYVYLAPFRDGSGYSGKMLRYDTSKTFTESASWETFDVGTPKGFDAAIFDDVHQYVYFVPYYSTGNEGSILRYNTNGAFNIQASWEVFEASDIVDSDSIGYHDGVFDGKYIYFTPRHDTAVYAEVLRYDTTKEFSDLCSWKAYKPPVIDDGGYVGGIFDGRYVYFSPWYNFSEGYHGKVLRFDAALCGDDNHPYPQMDFNYDCRVNMADFAMFSGHWLECTSPECD